MSAFGWKDRVSAAIFENSAIERRHSWIDPARFAEEPSWQELTEEYELGAKALGVAAAQQAMDGTGAADIGLIAFASVTGYTCPSMSYPIAAALGLPQNVVHADLIGQGCQAGLPALERARDYVAFHPDRRAIAMSVEICSATWFPALETDREYVVSSAIFGDGASAAIVQYSDDERYPELCDFESFYSPEYLHLLGYRWEQGRLKVVLSREVPTIVPPLIKQTVGKLLERNHLSKSDISAWVLHPGGRSVLEGIERELGLTRDQTRFSWEVMRDFGNVSSATLGIIARYTHHQERPPKGWGIACTMGAGTGVQACLVRWGQ